MSIGNKIVFTDGNYDSPYIREIIEVLTDNATEYEIVKERIFNVEKGKSAKQDEVRIFEKMFGNEFVVSYTSGVNGVYGWQNGQRKRTTRRTVVRNYLNKQYGRRNDKQSQETPINDITPVKKTSSKDGVFSYGEKVAYAKKFYGYNENLKKKYRLLKVGVKNLHVNKRNRPSC